MGVGRILHAMPVFSEKTKMYKVLFEPIAPLNGLVSYAYLRGSSPAKTIKRFETMLPLWDGCTLAIDCGIYTFKTQVGLSAQSKDTQLEYDEIKKKALKRFPEFESYVREYGEFLVRMYDKYTYAFDFDADPLIGAEMSDKLSEILFGILGDKVDKLARVYHIAREGVEKWWDDVCADPRFRYVAIEGGQMHRATPEFYRYLIEKASRGGKRVHVLAMSGATFPREVPADYMDCSTYSMGGRKALIHTSLGTFQVGKYFSQRHLLAHPQAVQDAVKKFVEGYGYTLEQLMDHDDDKYLRQQFNIIVINDLWDVPYELPELSTGRLF